MGPQQWQRCAAACEAELFSTTRDRKCLLEVLESVPVFKDLHGQTVLRRDGGHVGSVHSPHMVGWSDEYECVQVFIYGFVICVSISMQVFESLPLWCCHLSQCKYFNASI